MEKVRYCCVLLFASEKEVVDICSRNRKEIKLKFVI